MLGSLYSGVTGLRNHQVRLNVIGNNIANVNTIGYKKNRTTFQSALSQTLRSPYPPDASGTKGGSNPVQVGTGVRISTIDTIHEQGDLASTGRTLDLAVEGEGYFILNYPDGPKYTRAGSFDLDVDRNLVNPGTGGIVQGWMASNPSVDLNDEMTLTAGNLTNINIPETVPDPSNPANSLRLETLTVDDKGQFIGVLEDQTITVLARLALAVFSNPGGLSNVAGTSFEETLNSGAANIGAPQIGGRGQIATESLEMSNVDLVSEFTDMIATQRGFQANSRVITTSDEILQEVVNLKR